MRFLHDCQRTREESSGSGKSKALEDFISSDTPHVTRHYTSLRRPDSAQIRYDVGTVRLNGNVQGSDAVAATQGVRSTRMSSAREGWWHLSLAVRSAPGRGACYAKRWSDEV